MKSFHIIGITLLVAGLALLIAALYQFINGNYFKKISVPATGIVVDIIHGSEGARYPLIKFNDNSGKEVIFKSNTSLQSAYLGKEVKIRYLPEDSTVAKIDDFFSLNIIGMVMGIFAIVCLLVGAVFFGSAYREMVSERNAKNYTNIINAKVTSVYRDTSVSVNGRSPFVIEAQWVDPLQNVVHQFKSKRFWYDPSGLLQENITVKTDPDNFKKYWMDTTFLPKKA